MGTLHGPWETRRGRPLDLSPRAVRTERAGHPILTCVIHLPRPGRRRHRVANRSSTSLAPEPSAPPPPACPVEFCDSTTDAGNLFIHSVGASGGATPALRPLGALETFGTPPRPHSRRDSFGSTGRGGKEGPGAERMGRGLGPPGGRDPGLGTPSIRRCLVGARRREQPNPLTLQGTRTRGRASPL